MNYLRTLIVSGLSLIIAANAPTPVLVETTPHYTEGVVFDASGALYFSQTELGLIRRIPPEGGPSREWALVPAVNGHKILPNGMHVAAGAHGFYAIADDGRVRALIREVDGKELIAPNDITVEPRGGFYFTDAGSNDGFEMQGRGSVYYVDPSMRAHQISKGYAYANGLVVSADGTRLFVAESATNRIWEVPLSGPGKAGARKMFAQLPAKGKGQSYAAPDGLIIDPATGNLLVAHFGARKVLAYGMDGRLRTAVAAGNEATSNLAFRPGTNSLYISGSPNTDGPGAIYRLDFGTAR